MQTMIYGVILKNGIQRNLSRDEAPDKSVIGLWKWAQNQVRPIMIDFNEAVVMSDEIAMIDRPYTLEDTVREEDRADVEAREAVGKLFEEKRIQDEKLSPDQPKTEYTKGLLLSLLKEDTNDKEEE
jgi:hypothetical protein